MAEREQDKIPPRTKRYAAVMAEAEKRAGEARKALARAYDLADRFDADPNYDARSFRFVAGAESFTLHYLLGRTARDSIAYIVRLIGSEALTSLRKEFSNEE